MHENAGREGGRERPANKVSRVVQGLSGLYAKRGQLDSSGLGGAWSVERLNGLSNCRASQFSEG